MTREARRSWNIRLPRLLSGRSTACPWGLADRTRGTEGREACHLRAHGQLVLGQRSRDPVARLVPRARTARPHGRLLRAGRRLLRDEPRPDRAAGWAARPLPRLGPG